MKNPLKETLEQLNNDPRVIKATAMGTERELITDMIEKLEENIKDGNCSLSPREICQFLLQEIRNERHWKNIDWI